jgi:voltage-gated potassium channel
MKTQRTSPTLQMRQHWHSSLYQFKVVGLLFIILAFIGISFYCSVLHWPVRDALLQVVYTVSTLGGEARHGGLQLPIAEWFQIGYITTFIIVALWGASLLIEAMVQGELVYYLGARRMEQRIAKLSGHCIICGYGRMGREIARQFTLVQQQFVVVEHNPVQIAALEMSDILYVPGDAREDEQLLNAGIKKAKGLVAVASTDEENVYITLSARVLNPDVFIVTRSSIASGEPKLLRAGANRVFSPYIVGGRRMALAMTQPTVVDFLDTVIHDEQMELVMEEVTINDHSPIIGKAIRGEYDVESLGIHLLAITTEDGTMLMRNLEHHHVASGDTLILLGEPTAMHTAVLHLTGETS